MLRKKMFISGVKVTHELDKNREVAKHTIDNLGFNYSAFAYKKVPESLNQYLDQVNIEDFIIVSGILAGV